MRFLLDANLVIRLLQRDRDVVRRAQRSSATEVLVSALVEHELYFGPLNGRQPEANIAILKGLRLDVLPFDSGDARRGAEIRAALKRAGTPPP